jgi:hypothetical protein
VMLSILCRCYGRAESRLEIEPCRRTPDGAMKEGDDA